MIVSLSWLATAAFTEESGDAWKRSTPIPFFFSSLAFLLNGASILRLLLRNAIETAAHVFPFSLPLDTQVRVEIRDYGRGSHG